MSSITHSAKRKSATLFCCALLLCPLLGIHAQEASDAEMQDAEMQDEELRFPVIEATTVSGEALPLPAGLRAQWNFIALSHERKHGAVAEKWSEYLDQQVGEGTEFAAVPLYAMLVVDNVPKWIQKLISGAIRPDIAEEDYWRFLFIFQNRKPIVEAYNLKERKEMLIILMARDGTTHILADKPFGDEGIEQFQANLARYKNLLQ